jgi:hypothetical protein
MEMRALEIVTLNFEILRLFIDSGIMEVTCEGEELVYGGFSGFLKIKVFGSVEELRARMRVPKFVF